MLKALYHLQSVTYNVTGVNLALHITPQITGDKKQSEAALFGVRVNLPCYVFYSFNVTNS